jgi:hypothetical protein
MYLRCQKCGAMLPEHLLDAKPVSLANIQATSEQLAAAAERGEDFTVLQCQPCYGADWAAGISGTSIDR